MNTNDLQIRIEVNATAQQAFECINRVTDWWTENLEGASGKLGDEFAVHFGDVHYSKQKLVEFIPNQKVAWLVTEGRMSFVEDQQEWVGTHIVFDLEEHHGKTQVTFTHIGLQPEIECYDACSNAWGGYVRGSLANLINTGKGSPTPKEKTVASS